MDELEYFKNAEYYDEIINNYDKSPKEESKWNVQRIIEPEPEPEPEEPKGPKVKRPMNPFMLWLTEQRTKLKSKRKKKGTKPPGELVKELSAKWKAMSEKQKEPFIKQAAELKEQHKIDHPDYQYHPNRKWKRKAAPPPKPITHHMSF